MDTNNDSKQKEFDLYDLWINKTKAFIKSSLKLILAICRRKKKVNPPVGYCCITSSTWWLHHERHWLWTGTACRPPWKCLWESQRVDWSELILLHRLLLNLQTTMMKWSGKSLQKVWYQLWSSFLKIRLLLQWSWT